jgi:hypothetical protein
MRGKGIILLGAATLMVVNVAFSPASSGGCGTYPTGDFRPPGISTTVDNAIRDAVAQYNLPRWYFYAQIERESSYNVNAVGAQGEKGLTQLNGSNYEGMPYPYGLSAPDDNYKQWGYDMGFSQYGRWIKMSEVSQMSDWRSASQNVNRFSTVYAVRAFQLWQNWYGLSDQEALRAAAFHWKYGIFTSYNRNETSYLGRYDELVNKYRAPVERQDGRWNGQPCIPA